MSNPNERAEAEASVMEFLREGAAALRKKQTEALNRSHAIIAVRNQLFSDQFEESLTKIFKNKIFPGEYRSDKPVAKEAKRRKLHTILSDLHFHSLLNAAECVSAYGPQEEARRIASVAVQIADYKPQYRAETDLNIHLLGDIIQNQLYDARDGAPLAEQCAASMYLLTQTFLYLGTKFPHVTVRCTPGNHGRWTSRHKDRAVCQKWDAIETQIYYAVKLALSVGGASNIDVEIPKTPFYTWKDFDRYGFATHGDTVINPGNPAKMLDMTNIRRQMNSINAGLGRQKKMDFGLFICGHVHFGNVSWPPGLSNFISNGALIPTDQYGISIGETETRTGQVLWESVRGHILGDVRFLEVDASVDRDSGLDKIVKPFLGF